MLLLLQFFAVVFATPDNLPNIAANASRLPIYMGTVEECDGPIVAITDIATQMPYCYSQGYNLKSGTRVCASYDSDLTRLDHNIEEHELEILTGQLPPLEEKSVSIWSS